jgi:hypothetical protein
MSSAKNLTPGLFWVNVNLQPSSLSTPTVTLIPALDKPCVTPPAPQNTSNATMRAVKSCSSQQQSLLLPVLRSVLEIA